MKPAKTIPATKAGTPATRQRIVEDDDDETPTAPATTGAADDSAEDNVPEVEVNTSTPPPKQKAPAIGVIGVVSTDQQARSEPQPTDIVTIQMVKTIDRCGVRVGPVNLVDYRLAALIEGRAYTVPYSVATVLIDKKYAILRSLSVGG